MLPPFIIEQIRQREKQRQEQPMLELPLPPPRRPMVKDEDDEPDRGVVIIEMF